MCRFLYRGSVKPRSFPEVVFVVLIEMATKSDFFIFDNCICRQIHGVLIGSLLELLIANIFVGFHEKQLFDIIAKPCCYFLYINDTFTSFSSRSKAKEFFSIY